MKAVLAGIALALVAMILVALPSLRRYIKIERM